MSWGTTTATISSLSSIAKTNIFVLAFVSISVAYQSSISEVRKQVATVFGQRSGGQRWPAGREFKSPYLDRSKSSTDGHI